MSSIVKSNFRYFQNLEDEIKIIIFKYAESPIDLALTCRRWSDIAKDPYAKTEWLIAHFGKAHAMFHAVRLGPTFIDVEVCQNLFARKVIISRYFIQRLLMHFGRYDQKLIELKIEHNIGQLDADRIRTFQKTIVSPWASTLPIFVFTYLLEEGFKHLANEMPLKGNDMELFHFLSAGPHVINYAPGMLRKNLKNIEKLILDHKFTPFPPRPKLQLNSNTDPHIHQPPIPEEYPPKDGYENNRQLNVIARAILIHPDLVNLWIEIGYKDICNDVNDLVMQGALLILFPPTPASDWHCPTVSIVISRLEELIKLGFQLKDIVIVDALHMFEHRLDEIGNILWNAFRAILSSESMESLAYKFFKEALKPERNLKKDELLNFLKSKFDYHERIVKEVVKDYFIKEKMSDITKRRKSLILSQKVYQYILNTYGNKSELTLMCFEDILTLRIFIDTEHESELSECTYDSIKSTFDLYNKASVPYKPAQLDLLKQATNFEIIRPFFDDFLPTIFGFKSKPKKKRKKLDDLALLWVEQLEHINSQNYIGIPTTLKDLFMNFYKRLENEEIIIKYHIQGDIYRQHKKQKQNNINVNFNNMYY